MGTIRRGTTPEHTFITSLNLSGAESLYITYQQRGKTVLEKTLEDCLLTEDSITVRLSQEDTLKFNWKEDVEIQIRAVLSDGAALASNIMVASAQRILKEGEI